MKNKVATLKAAAPLTLCNPLTPAFFLITLALLSAGCLGSRPLKGGKALTSRTPTGDVAQTLIQGDNPAQASKQDLDTVRIRTYTLPPGTRVESPINPTIQQSNNPACESFVLTAPTSVAEREETPCHPNKTTIIRTDPR